MINLWYNENIKNGLVRGPRKVLENLHDSLEEQNILFAVNEDKYKYNFLVHYDDLGYSKHEKLEHDSCIIGPQIWPFDEYGQFLKNNPQYYKKIIVPGDSAYLSFKQQGFNESKLAKWPIGIKDINVERSGNIKFLVYFKRRSVEDLDSVLFFLNEKKYDYHILKYGKYSQEEFNQALQECSHGIIVDGPETQGIAIQEMMSSNMPLLIWDNLEYFEDGVPEEYTKNLAPTSAHYFSAECGEKVYSEDEFKETFNKFMKTQYTPKEYIKRELSYEITIKKLFALFEE